MAPTSHHTRLIGITGGIGSGKSYVAAALHEQGYPVYDCDNEAKRIIQQDSTVQQAIIQLLGEEAYLHVQNQLSDSPRIYNHKYVAAQVFQHPHLLQQLNAIVHPAVYQDIQAWRLQQDTVYAFVESAILFESNLAPLFDAVICITAPLEQRIQRAMGRNRSTREQVEQRIRNQMNDTQRQALSSLVVHNDDSTSLKQTVTRILTFLHQQYANTSTI